MSYEETSLQQWPCPCGDSTVLMTTYENDWGQTRDSIEIKCPTCKTKYELEYKYQPRNGFVESYPVLVSKVPVPAPVAPTINVVTTPLHEQYCITFTKEQLQAILSILLSVTSTASIQDNLAMKVVRMSYRTAHTRKRSHIIDVVRAAISCYDEYPESKEKIAKQRAEYERIYPCEIYPLR